jgi:hypothetical protein
MSAGPRHIEVIYCDDIRQEVGNKLSYMGVYSGELNIQTAPVVLPKLCISIKAISDMQDPFEALEIRVLRVKGTEEIELLSTGPATLPARKPSTEGGMSYMVAHFAFVLAPFPIDEEFLIRIRAKTEREELRGAGLRVRVGQPLATPENK